MAGETNDYLDSELVEEKVAHDGQPMYSLGNKRPIAYCCLIANSGENTNTPLYYTANDLQHVSTTFKLIQAKVVIEQRYRGMEFQDVKNLLNQLKAMDLKECPCFIFYYSGHGKDCGIQLGENSTFPFREIVELVTSLPDLGGKPKVFIFDCCRVRTDKPASCQACKAESFADCVIAYACSDGEQAFITNSPNMINNSIFTKAFCSMLKSNHRQWPLMSVLIHASSLTNKTMKGYFSAQARREDGSVSAQTPIVFVKLQKQLYLCCKLHVKIYIE